MNFMFSRNRFVTSLFLFLILASIPAAIVYILHVDQINIFVQDMSTDAIPACIQTLTIEPRDFQAPVYTGTEENERTLQSIKNFQMNMHKCFRITLSKEEQQALRNTSLANEIRRFKEQMLKLTSGIKGLNLMEQVVDCYLLLNKTPAVKFLGLIFRNNFFIFNFSNACSR